DGEGQGPSRPPVVHAANARQRLEPERPAADGQVGGPSPSREGPHEFRPVAPRSSIGSGPTNLERSLYFLFSDTGRTLPTCEAGDGSPPSARTLLPGARSGVCVRRPPVSTGGRRQRLLHRSLVLSSKIALLRRHRLEEERVQAGVRREDELL